MTRKTAPLNSHSAKRAPKPDAQRGVALLITLGLLALLGAASLAIIYLTSSDALINGYYRNYRGSFYAADSGANIVTEAMKNAVASSAPSTLATFTNPLPISGAIPTPSQFPYTGTPGTLSALTTSYAAYQNGYYKIGDTGSWNSQFEMVTNPAGVNPVVPNPTTQPATFTVQCPEDSNCMCESTACCTGGACVATPCPAGVAGPCQTDGNYLWTFSYPYEITIKGQSSGTEDEEITETGTITYSASPGIQTSGGLPTFSHWATFIAQFALCQGELVPGTTYGPAFSDQSWNFGNSSNPGYTFAGTIGQASSTVGYYEGNNCVQGGATPPSGFHLTFEKGFTTGDTKIDEPQDSWSQEMAVVNAKGAQCNTAGCNDNAPTTTQLSTLETVTGTPYSSSTTGVFIPMYQTVVNGQTVNMYGSNPNDQGDSAGGGFLVNGDASITLSATTDSGGNPTQTYTISQTTTTGSGFHSHSTTTTTTIVVDPSANNGLGSTTVQQGSGTPLTLTGMPTQLDPATGTPMVQNDPSGQPVNPTMIYVANGSITGLSGTVQNNTGITIASDSDINITGDLTYASASVNSSDQLVSNTNAGVLGIYTRGNIDLSPDSSGNLTIDASLAMLSGNTTSGTSGLETNSSINNLTIVGGRAEDQAHSVSINSSTTLYDQRFAGNFAPPWFPTAIPSAAGAPIQSTLSMTVTRTGWQDTNRN